jgi:hypothetical protein
VSTVIRRRLPSGNEAVDVQLASRVCSQDSWVPYWLCLAGGKVYVGVGRVPGERCMGVLDDTLYNQLRSGMDAVKYVGLSNSALGKNARPLKVRNVVVTTVPEALRTTLDALAGTDFPMVNVDAETNEESRAMMEEYEKECAKAKARAKKFNIPYQEPNPQAFLNWSRARRLRANPQKGFATGMDISAPEELEKQRKRAERFGTTTNAKRERVEEGDNAVAGEEGGGSSALDTIPLVTIAEAWDNEELVRPHRTDPPKVLWVNPPDDTVEENDGEGNYTMIDAGPPTLSAEKIHLCSVDWSAFKQIRTDDIMVYFGSYGPSYVEWLGELSCNVYFEDKFSAARALQNLSQALPSPPPEDVVAAKLQQQQQQDGATAVGDDDDAMVTSSSPVPDLGAMGWFVCQKPIRKVTNDRYGRRGTTARILMRTAASTDILLQRPASTPAPPPGFTTKRVLGPGCDFDRQHRHKRRRRDYDGSNEERGEVNTYPDGVDHPLMSQGLRSGRDGYSMEDMETERGQVTEGATMTEETDVAGRVSEKPDTTTN